MCILAYPQKGSSSVGLGVLHFTLLSNFRFFFVKRFLIFYKTYQVAEALNGSSLDRYSDMFNSCFVLVFSRLLLFLYLLSIIVYVHRKQSILNYLKSINIFKYTDRCVFLHTYKMSWVQLGLAFFNSLFCQFSDFFSR